MKTRIEEYIGLGIPEADVCIVGGGAAGIEIAQYLGGKGLSIMLLEGGEEIFHSNIQDLYRFQSFGRPIRSVDRSGPYNFSIAKKQECRLRQYGGTLNIWSGKWKVLDPIDFEKKEFIEESGWPITYNEILPYYRAIADDYGGGIQLLLDGSSKKTVPEFFKRFPEFVPSVHYRESASLNMKTKFDRQISDAENVRLILGANVTGIELSVAQDHVKGLSVSSLDGHRWMIGAKCFILACGTLENTRLLLCSNEKMKKGIGNDNGLVGRYLMDHPKGIGGMLMLSEREQFLFSDRGFGLNPGGYEIGLSLHPSLLRKLKLPNHCLRLVLSPEKGESVLYLRFLLEQVPNPKSWVFLTEERDSLGMPILGVDWQMSEQDRQSFTKYTAFLNQYFAEHGLGSIFLKKNASELNFLKDASHQMGTTRMGISPKDGVVDGNCKVFGIDNLYIAGSSVFPAAGNAHPTFTVLALARRLSDHLNLTNFKNLR